MKRGEVRHTHFVQPIQGQFLLARSWRMFLFTTSRGSESIWTSHGGEAVFMMGGKRTE